MDTSSVFMDCEMRNWIEKFYGNNPKMGSMASAKVDN